MLTGPTPEYPPLLAAGSHPMTIAELRALCTPHGVAASVRHTLMDGVEKLVDEVRAAGLSGVAWIDGSFLTRKTEPKDADLVFIVNSMMLPNPTQRDMLKKLSTKGFFKLTHGCDAFVGVYFPINHQNYPLSVRTMNYWRQLWESDRNGAPKGFAVVTI